MSTTVSIKVVKKTLSNLEKAAREISKKVLDIEKEKVDILQEISNKYKVKNPELVYNMALEEFIEGADECLDTDGFFVLKDGIFGPNQEMEFLYSLWEGEYYTDKCEISALEKYTEELLKKSEGDFVDYCAPYSK